MAAQAVCYERFYTAKHLKENEKQEIRSVLVSTNSSVFDFDWDDKATTTVLIHGKRDGRDFLAEVSGNCYEGKCNFNGQGSESATYKKIESEGELGINEAGKILFNVAKDFVYNDVTLGAPKGAKIKLTDYDDNFRVDINELESVYSATSGCSPVLKMVFKQTIPRLWNEVLLHSVRNDLARPTVTARNLYHMSALLWDVYSAYDENLKGFFTDEKAPKYINKSVARDKAMSFAAHDFLKARYKLSPGNGDTWPVLDGPLGGGKPDFMLNKLYDRILRRLGHSPTDSWSKHADFGRMMAKKLIASQLNDGSREKENHAPREDYVMKNKFAIDISQSGMRTPIDLSKESYGAISYIQRLMIDYFGKDLIDDEQKISKIDPDFFGNPSFAKDNDINFWTRLFVPGAIDQNGTASVAPAQKPLTVFWGELPTFSDLKKYKSGNKDGVYFDPGKDLPKFEVETEKFIIENLRVIEQSALLNPMDMSGFDFDRDGKPDHNPGADLLDISPLGLGGNTLGTDDGVGRKRNPVTGEIYKSNLVKAADYYRSIAEFWADGPDSETPPGHWNTMANYVVDQLLKRGEPLKFMGKELDREEHELKLYLTLNGALHDAAVVAWGIKGHYQGNRPVVVIRKLSDMAEKDSVFANKLVAMSPEHLKMVTYKKSILQKDGSEKLVKVTKLAVKSWRGPGFGGYHSSIDGSAEFRNFSFRNRDKLAIEENQVFGSSGAAGAGWILAENWVPYQRPTFVTPPFPGFISGHSTFSRAAAEILAGVTGSEFFPGGLGVYKAPDLHFEHDKTDPFEFQWATYYDAADVSGKSRIYGGIHASYDDYPGRKIGAQIGKEALVKARQIFK